MKRQVQPSILPVNPEVILSPGEGPLGLEFLQETPAGTSEPYRGGGANGRAWCTCLLILHEVLLHSVRCLPSLGCGVFATILNLPPTILIFPEDISSWSEQDHLLRMDWAISIGRAPCSICILTAGLPAVYNPTNFITSRYAIVFILKI